MDVAPAIVVISSVALETAQKITDVLKYSLIHGFCPSWLPAKCGL